MDARRFDLLARDWAASRRRVLALATAAAALRLIGGEDVAAASRKNGAMCDRNSQCSSRHCCPSRCQTCCSDQHCGPFEVCVCPQCSCAAVSDRAMKADVIPADGKAVLAKLAALPIATWRYRSDHPAVRHIGPMAQDFAAAFGVGDTDRAIHVVDGQGVALAAIQALQLEVAELRSQLAVLRETETP